MPVTNSNKKIVDVPFFETMNFGPVATTSTSAITVAEGGGDRFIYYMTFSSFFRYDTYADTYQALAFPAVGPLIGTTLRYTRYRGFHQRVIAATSSTIQFGGLRGGILSGDELEILSGTGAGQKRTITFSSEAVHDSGFLTNANTNLSVTDSSKKWKINQWAGYTVTFTHSNAATQQRKIIYNDANTLYFGDANLLPHDPWAALSVAPSVSASIGSQTSYTITSQTFTLNSNWTTTPDRTSYFTVKSGGIYFVSSSGTTPFLSLQFYDVAHDLWYTKTVPQGLVLSSIATDFAIERPSTGGTAPLTNTGAISGGARTLTDAGLTLSTDRYANYRIKITGGTGAGQNRRIVGNTATVFTVAKPWATNPDSTSTYEIWPDYDRLWFAGNGAASMFAYSPENDLWMQGQLFDDGVTTNMSCALSGWMPFGISSGVRIAAGVTAVNSAPTAGGTNYVVGDVLTCAVGGSGAQVIVTSTSPGGIVTGIELMHSGTVTGYAVGTGRATTGGSGTGCTIEITSVGVTAVLTLATNHYLRRGDSVTIAGCSEAAWNGAYTIIGTPGITTICVVTTATAAPAATSSQSTTLIVDSTKNWTVNEHVGRLVHVCVAGAGPTSQIRWITANTATTLTVATITAAVSGTSKYAIYDSKLFGVDVQRRAANEAPYGYATSGTTTSLTDSSKNWVTNQWAGYLFKVEAGTGYGSGRISITSNTATTLNFSTQSFTPDATTKYEIADAWGLATSGSTTVLTESTTKNWLANQWSGGKRLRLAAGTGTGNEYIITTSAATTLSFSTATAPDATTAYAILGPQPRSSGTDLIWVWGGSNAADKGRYMYSPRGGTTSGIDIYDITTGRWIYNPSYSPQSQNFAAGTSYTYDGVDTIYICNPPTGSTFHRVFALDVRTGAITAFGQTTQIGGLLHAGHFFEYVLSPDGVPFLYFWHNTSTAVSRAMVF
jgi:hypothetical protein